MWGLALSVISSDLDPSQYVSRFTLSRAMCTLPGLHRPSSLAAHILTHLIDLTSLWMWTTPPFSFLGLDVRVEPKRSFFEVQGGLVQFHTPRGLVQMLRRFNTSDHTASRVTTRISPEQQTVAILLRHEMSRNKLPRKMSPR
jgi:hypothetical protein